LCAPDQVHDTLIRKGCAIVGHGLHHRHNAKRTFLDRRVVVLVDQLLVVKAAPHFQVRTIGQITSVKEHEVHEHARILMRRIALFTTLRRAQQHEPPLIEILQTPDNVLRDISRSPRDVGCRSRQAGDPGGLSLIDHGIPQRG